MMFSFFIFEQTFQQTVDLPAIWDAMALNSVIVTQFGQLEWTSQFRWASWYSLQWRHNERDGVSNHQPHDCLINPLFRHRSRKHQNSASLAYVRGIHRSPANSPHKWPVTRKMFPFHDIIMFEDFRAYGKLKQFRLSNSATFCKKKKKKKNDIIINIDKISHHIRITIFTNY